MIHMKISAPQWNWAEIGPDAYEAYGQHAYYQARRNSVTGKWALGRRLGGPERPVRLIGLYPTLEAAQEVAASREATL